MPRKKTKFLEWMTMAMTQRNGITPFRLSFWKTRSILNSENCINLYGNYRLKFGPHIFKDQHKPKSSISSTFDINSWEDGALIQAPLGTEVVLSNRKQKRSPKTHCVMPRKIKKNKKSLVKMLRSFQLLSFPLFQKQGTSVQ